MKNITFSKIAIMCALFLTLTAGTALAAEKTYTNSIGMEFVLLPSGSLTMGCDRAFESCFNWEKTPHKSTIKKAFYMGKYEVTQAQWVEVMGTNPSQSKARSKPVSNISLQDARAFVQRLNKLEDGNKYRLPTDAEWEYAYRAGTKTTYFWGDEASGINEYGRINMDVHPNSDNLYAPVGSYKPNQWGLYDMVGNVREWIEGPSPHDAKKHTLRGSGSIAPGGDSWKNEARSSMAGQFALEPHERYFYTGLRVVRNAD